MKLGKTLFLVAIAVIAIGVLSTPAAAAACGQANASSCTSALTASITVTNAVWLQFYQDTTNSGCAFTGQTASGDTALTDGTLAFPTDANALGIGASGEPACITVTKHTTGSPTATDFTVYRTSYQLFYQFSGFTNNSGTITAYRGAFTNNTGGSLDMLEGAFATADTSLGSLSANSGSPSAVASGLTDAGTGGTNTRKLAFKVIHKNGANTSGAESVLVTYTLTAS